MRRWVSRYRRGPYRKGKVTSNGDSGGVPSRRNTGKKKEMSCRKGATRIARELHDRKRLVKRHGGRTSEEKDYSIVGQKQNGGKQAAKEGSDIV